MSTQAQINNIVAIIAEKLEGGLGDLLGCPITIEPATSGLIAKEDFFDQFRKKLVMVDVEMTGARTEHLFLFGHLADAVLLGGTLIMLPPAELERKVRKEDFSEDEEDAFGEITNILTGELNQAFDEAVGEDLHFRKNGQQVVMPVRARSAESGLVPPGQYFRVSLSLTFDGQVLQNLEILFPPVLFGLADTSAAESVAEPAAESAVKPVAKSAAESAVKPAAKAAAKAAAESVAKPVTKSAAEPAAASAAESSTAASPESVAGQRQERPLLLIVTAGAESSHDLVENCQAEGFAVRTVGCQDDFQVVALPGETSVRGVLLQMDESKEQGLASIIKARSVFGDAIPLIALGAQWTRSQVMQAARYGVRDIVVTPALPQDIREKLCRHFLSEG